MRKAIFLASVRDDLLQIFDYIATESNSISIAQAFVVQLRSQCHKLASFRSKVGRARPELRADIRSFPYKGYVIFFRYVEDRFEVVNILHGHRDFDTFFEDL